MSQLIETQRDFDIICGEAVEMPWVGLDTEFRRIRTYYPKLCLIQVSTKDKTVCIDPLANLDFSAFTKLLTNPSVLKIFHSARQDLEVLSLVFNVKPTPLFDTQIAAQLCGYREQIGYADLTERICGVSLAKEHTRTDWCRRPLSGSEVEYALDDARYLGPIYSRLEAELVKLNRVGWVNEDCERLVDLDIAATGSQRAIEKIQSRASSFDQTKQSVAYELAMWREAKAQSRDTPREWILRSEELLAIVEELPRYCKDLDRSLRLATLDGSRWKTEFPAVIKRGVEKAESYQSMKPSVRPSSKEKRREQILWNHLVDTCLAANISTGTVSSRNEIRKLSRGEKDLDLLRGWREKFIGRDLCAIFWS
jgi:ribonuclease D